jgi:hypothetical protein
MIRPVHQRRRLFAQTYLAAHQPLPHRHADHRHHPSTHSLGGLTIHLHRAERHHRAESSSTSAAERWSKNPAANSSSPRYMAAIG